MPENSEERPPPPGQPEGELWEPLHLEAESGPPAVEDKPLPGGETVERPIAELVGPEALPAASLWLARWLLFCGIGAGALAVAGVAAALLHGVGHIAWRGGLFALDCAVVILVIRAYLVASTPARTVCHRVFSLAGLGAAAFAIQLITVRSAARFIFGEAPPSVLTHFFIFGLLGLAGCIVFVQCLREVRWACRVAAVSSLIFALLVLFRALSAGDLFGGRASLSELTAAAHVPPLGATILLAAAFAFAWERLRTAPRRLKVPLIALILAALAGAGGWLGFCLESRGGAEAAFRGLWLSSACWEVLALLPVCVAGMWLAWRRRGHLESDALAAGHLIWVLVVLGALACVSLWLPARLGGDRLGMAVLGAGVVAAVLGAWLGATQGDWFSRWALLPAGALVVGVLCALGPLLRLAAEQGGLWRAITAFLWAVLVVGLALACGGLAVRRRRLRMENRPPSLWIDASALAMAGLVGSTFVLWVIFGLGAGAPAVSAKLADLLRGGLAHAEDVLTLAGGRALAARLPEAVPAVAGMTGPLGLVFLVVLTVHLLAAARVRWMLYCLAFFYGTAVALGAVLALGLATRLFFPPGEPLLRTTAGRLTALYFPVRLVATAAVVALVARVGEAVVSVLRLCTRPHRRPGRGLVPMPREETGGDFGETHLSFLVRVGTIAGAAGLVGGLMLNPHPAVRQVLRTASEAWRNWSVPVAVLAGRAGQLTTQWLAYALAAGLAAYLLLMLSQEGRKGRLAAYPLLGAFWAIVVAYLAAAWMRSARSMVGGGLMPSVTAAVTALPWVALLCATVFLWARWWRLSAPTSALTGQMKDPSPQKASAGALGALGLALCLAGVGAMVHGALGSVPGYAAVVDRLTQGAIALAEQCLANVVALTAHWGRNELSAFSLALMAASAVVLVIHLLAQRSLRTWRALLLGIWTTAVLAGGVAVVYWAAHAPARAWGAAELAGLLVLSFLLMRVLVALVNVRQWISPE